MGKPKKYFNNCNQEYVYTADEMDAYLDSLKKHYEPVVDREMVIQVIIPYTRGLWSSCMVNKDDMCSEGMIKHVENLESELADEIISAMYGGEK